MGRHRSHTSYSWQVACCPGYMRVAAAFLLSTSLWAQAAFQNLAPNSDGSRVYFSSPLRLKGTDEYPNQPKIFSWDQKGAVHLYEQKPPSILNFVPGLGWDSTTAYNLIAPSTSSDARTIAITGLSDCNDGEDCAYSVNRYQAEIRVAGGAPIVMNGVPSVSPNGHYVALGPSVQHSFATPLTILQLATGNQAHIVNILGFARRHGIANDGTTFVNDTSLPNPVQIRRWWGAMEPLNANPYTPAQIDGAATHVFYTSFDHPSTETPLDLIALDIATNVSTILSSVDLQSASSFDISDDGSLVGFVRLGSAWLVHSDGSGLLQIPKLNDNVVEVAVSGDGNHLFVITASSQIVRIDLATMSVAEIIPATPAPSGLN